jgi:CubicO group peptidase (beta-lactamase class C family)
MRQAHVPGLGLALIRESNIVWQGAFGVKRTDTAELLTTETQFQAASLSKPLFAYGVLHLVEQGVLELDRPLTAYLPTPIVSDDPLLDQITTRMVLCHLTGWPNWREDGQPLVRQAGPGAQFGYSGEGFGYLQQVVEQVSGQPLDRFMRQMVFVPLGMSQSTYPWAVPDETDGAFGHEDVGKLSIPFSMAGPHAAASLQTTPSEYARFVCAMLEPETASHSLSEALRAEMVCPQVELEPALAWGLGWGLQQTEDGWAFWHSGDNPGFKNFALAYPQAQIGLVIMTNSDSGAKLWEPLLRLSLGGEYPLFAWRARQH